MNGHNGTRKGNTGYLYEAGQALVSAGQIRQGWGSFAGRRALEVVVEGLDGNDARGSS